jgi:hypothetical protein
MAGVYASAPELALCLVVDRLAAESSLLQPSAQTLRRVAASLAIGSAR